MAIKSPRAQFKYALVVCPVFVFGAITGLAALPVSVFGVVAPAGRASVFGSPIVGLLWRGSCPVVAFWYSLLK